MAYGDGLKTSDDGVWVWRWVVPPALRLAFSTKTIVRSLGTRDRREAVALSFPLRLAVSALARHAAQGFIVSDEELKRVLDQARIAARRLVDGERTEHEFNDAHAARAKAVRQRDVDQRRHSEALTHAVRATTLATVEATARKLGPPISECAKEFIREHTAKKAWTPKTAGVWEVTFRHLMDALGNPAVNSVSRNDMVIFLEQLRRLPANAQKMSNLKGKTFLELVEATGYKTIASQTINDFMTRVSGFFKWATKIEAYNLLRNPADGLSVSLDDVVKRRPFTPEHLTALFGHESWQTRTFASPHQFWLAPMAALTGMRLNEICQLGPADFIKVSGIDIIKCADLAEGTRRKNENATRRVPVHQTLIDMGLIRWVERMRKERQKQIFPELVAGRDGHGGAPSKWFSRYKEACGVTGAAYVFHSFRHFFISQRLNLEIAPHMVGAIVGHEQGVVTTDRYWSDREAEKMLAAVNAAGLPVEIILPKLEEVTFERIRRRPPSRLGARKTREQRIVDAAARKASKLIR